MQGTWGASYYAAGAGGYQRSPTRAATAAGEQIEGLNTAPSMRAIVSGPGQQQQRQRQVGGYQQDPGAPVMASSTMASTSSDAPRALPSSRANPWRSPEVSARAPGCPQPYASITTRRAAVPVPVSPQKQPAAGGQTQAGGSHTVGVAAALVAPPPSWTSRTARPVPSGPGPCRSSETPVSGAPTPNPLPMPSEPGVRVAASRARSVEPPAPAGLAGSSGSIAQLCLPTSRSLVPPVRLAASSSYVPAAPRFYSYTPAVGTNRPSSFTPSVSRTHGGGSASANAGGSPHCQVPCAPVRFFEGLSRPATSPLMQTQKSVIPVDRDRLMASMQTQHHVQPMVIEGIASAPGRHSMSRMIRPAPKASQALVQPPLNGTSMAASSSSSAAAGSPSPAMRSVQGGGRAPITPGVARPRGDGSEAFGHTMWNGEAESSTPAPSHHHAASSASTEVVNSSPPLMRYVLKGDGSVEQTQDNLQATSVPALAAAAMAAVKEAAGRSGVRRRTSPLGEAFASNAGADGGPRPIAAALERAAVDNGFATGSSQAAHGIQASSQM
eukprot:TRINITY_DN3159_c0_g1_i3.p1 TRINITY_DN3159_c0_g1~~TRINITY_DN3159_c0_g1_i3.p1  ORF type:complete len:553 (-),score=70.44 TRINITY_DN3159_c0_g1_i3:70-1728(-)